MDCEAACLLVPGVRAIFSVAERGVMAVLCICRGVAAPRWEEIGLSAVDLEKRRLLLRCLIAVSWIRSMVSGFCRMVDLGEYRVGGFVGVLAASGEGAKLARLLVLVFLAVDHGDHLSINAWVPGRKSCEA